MRDRRIRLWAPGCVVALIAMMVFTLPMAVSAQTGGIGGRPANPDAKNPRTESIFIYSLTTGAERSDQVLVTNNSGKKRTISLYAVDGVVTNTGAFTCKQKSEARVDAGDWVRFDKREVVLESGKEEKVGFTVTVPRGADVGEHSACVVFEDSNDEGEVKGGVRLRTRQAVRMAVTVPGDLRRSIEITDFAVEHKDDILKFHLELQNKGNVSADVYGRVTLRGLFNREVFKAGGQYPVMRDKQLDLSFDNTKLPFWGGWYTAQADISYDKAAGSFGVSEAEAKLVKKQSQTQTIFIAPSATATLVYALAVVALLGGVGYLLLRRKSERIRRTTWIEYKVKKSDTVQTIADAHNVDWKQLVSTNKIKAPYVISAGELIKVPNSQAKAKKPKD